MSSKEIIKKLLPKFLLDYYHWLWALCGALLYGFPSHKLTVIGVTGTSGKSTTVDIVSRIFEEAGYKTASLSSVRFKINNAEWKNELKMTMPGRLAIQKFLQQAVREKCIYAVLEVTSEGIAQHRHNFIRFHTAVFTNLSKEHIESHGSFENYRNEKIKLFKVAPHIHVVNRDDENARYFLEIPAKKTLTFGIHQAADVKVEDLISGDQITFLIGHTRFTLKLLGEFMAYNALAAITVAVAHGISLQTCANALEKITLTPGRMEIISNDPLVVIDYAHTPDQLEKVYQSFEGKSLVCVLGSCGGGRDKWKRPTLGHIAKKYCREVIVTNEDPYDEDPLEIINEVAVGVGDEAKKIPDRREAIQKAWQLTKVDDALVVTGKGSEPWMCIANGKKIPWDDRVVAREAINSLHHG